jgi:S1-C subfamily serine protease
VDRLRRQTSGVNTADWIAIGVVGLTALVGVRRGFVTGALSLAGLLTGALLGAQVAPKLIGEPSGYIALVALVGAAIGGMLGQMIGVLFGRSARQAFAVFPPLRILDSTAGIALGVVTGLALCWAVGAVHPSPPGQSELRRLAQETTVVSALTDALPPEKVMEAVGRIDPFSEFAGPDVDVADPDPGVAVAAGIRAARPSVVRVRGNACGLGVEGSGWIVRRGLVVTNAHVVAGIDTPVVDRGTGTAMNGEVVAFDAANDVAVIRVSGLSGRPLPLGNATRGLSAALLGFPQNGPYLVTPVRLGGTASVAARDAYGRIQVRRDVVGIRGDAESGNSGGPVVDEQGRVVATLFAKRAAVSGQGYALSNETVRNALANVGPRLRTACVER